VTLSIPDRWVWDFWLALDGDDWHAFYLHAPKALGDPEARHRNARIGHAVSRNLRDWQRLPDPFPAGSAGEWDDLANWTGSVVRVGAGWWMFYTGVSTVDGGNIQRIGAATSCDLLTWEKISLNPLCEADPSWYEKLDFDAWYEETWRDPWVFPDPNGGGFHMFVTARVAVGPAGTRGVIGHAVSADLVEWSARPPVFAPESFGYVEVPQQVTIDGRYYVIYSLPGDMQPGVRSEDALTGIGYAIADQPAGPFRRGPTSFVYADRLGTLYAGKIVFIDDRPMMLGTLHHGSNGRYLGGISDPIPISVSPDGSLALGSLSV